MPTDNLVERIRGVEGRLHIVHTATIERLLREAATEIERLAAAEVENARLRAELDEIKAHPSFWKLLPPPKPVLHHFVPHRKFPWFCSICGYAPHEPLKHIQEAPLPSLPEGSTDTRDPACIIL